MGIKAPLGGMGLTLPDDWSTQSGKVKKGGSPLRGRRDAAVYLESYRRDVCFHRARVNANSDAEARNEAPTVAAHTNATSYRIVSDDGENRRLVSANDGGIVNTSAATSDAF
jgi:hypothetical protein